MDGTWQDGLGDDTIGQSTANNKCVHTSIRGSRGGFLTINKSCHIISRNCRIKPGRWTLYNSTAWNEAPLNRPLLDCAEVWAKWWAVWQYKHFSLSRLVILHRRSQQSIKCCGLWICSPVFLILNELREWSAFNNGQSVGNLITSEVLWNFPTASVGNGCGDLFTCNPDNLFQGRDNHRWVNHKSSSATLSFHHTCKSHFGDGRLR